MKRMIGILLVLLISVILSGCVTVYRPRPLPPPRVVPRPRVVPLPPVVRPVPPRPVIKPIPKLSPRGHRQGVDKAQPWVPGPGK